MQHAYSIYIHIYMHLRNYIYIHITFISINHYFAKTGSGQTCGQSAHKQGCGFDSACLLLLFRPARASQEPADCDPWTEEEVRKRHCLRCHLYIEVIFLTRQARDKHRENLKRETVFSKLLEFAREAHEVRARRDAAGSTDKTITMI
eukprot:COSAG06_NODE_1925_length_8052_cov_11.269584_2_plen_147_part_00